MSNQRELHSPSALLDAQGRLTQVGWARQPLLDCNLENARFYAWRLWQRLRIKCWDYYGITTPFDKAHGGPTHFVSATLAHVGYVGMVFAYVVDLTTGHHHEETLMTPLGRGVFLPRNSTEGESTFDNGRVRMSFRAEPEARRLSVEWPGFGGGNLALEALLHLPPEHESMTIVIPIERRRFYYNRKVNCMPAEGWIERDGVRMELSPTQSLGNMDWGRGVWAYRSFWVWASASSLLEDGRTVGLNLGFGFGDTSAATENALILNGQIHKLGQVNFSYDAGDFMRPWRMVSDDGRLDLEFRPFAERVARSNLLLVFSEVHQMFGRYHGTVQADDGESIQLDGLIGFAEEHHARW